MAHRERERVCVCVFVLARLSDTASSLLSRTLTNCHLLICLPHHSSPVRISYHIISKILLIPQKTTQHRASKQRNLALSPKESRDIFSSPATSPSLPNPDLRHSQIRAISFHCYHCHRYREQYTYSPRFRCCDRLIRWGWSSSNFHHYMIPIDQKCRCGVVLIDRLDVRLFVYSFL